MTEKSHSTRQMLLAAFAAFATYFCMYAFRKPFTAGTFDAGELSGLELKSTLVISQLLGYMLSKVLGIKVVSELPARYRAISIVGLISAAELALIGFAFVPLRFKFLFMFVNGLSLGMVFGFVLGYLEGRKITEALSAALCASFIISSGVVKSVGRWLIETKAVSEFQMPMYTGFLFFLPLLISVFLLSKTPPPTADDREQRTDRSVMTRQDRFTFFRRYWSGLSLLLFVYVALTVIRTIRDDFAVEIWSGMGVTQEPSIFARCETVVAVVVTALSALAIWFKDNVVAMWATATMMCIAFGAVVLSTYLQTADSLSPFLFMVICGIGLYIPYVAFHTTVFERLISASTYPSNLGFLMYLADALGYLGYAAVLVLKSSRDSIGEILPFFRTLLVSSAGLCMVALIVAMIYFQGKLHEEKMVSLRDRRA